MSEEKKEFEGDHKKQKVSREQSEKELMQWLFEVRDIDEDDLQTDKLEIIIDKVVREIIKGRITFSDNKLIYKPRKSRQPAEDFEGYVFPERMSAKDMILANSKTDDHYERQLYIVSVLTGVYSGLLTGDSLDFSEVELLSYIVTFYTL